MADNLVRAPKPIFPELARTDTLSQMPADAPIQAGLFRSVLEGLVGSIQRYADDDFRDSLTMEEDALRTDGSRTGATGEAQSFGSTYGILTDLITESTGGAGVKAEGVQFKDSNIYMDNTLATLQFAGTGGVGEVKYQKATDLLYFTTSGTVAGSWDNKQNFGVGVAAVDLAGAGQGSLVMVNWTAPDGFATANCFALYSADLAAGNAAPHIRTENGTTGPLLVGPVGAVDNMVLRANGTATNKIQGSGVALDDNGNITFPDGASINLQEDITFTGATTENLIKMPDNLADALSIQEGTNKYITFDTTDTAEIIDVFKNVELAKADPEMRLTDTGDSEYTRVTRSDTNGMAIRYNRCYEPAATTYALAFGGTDEYVEDANACVTDYPISVSFWIKGGASAVGAPFAVQDSGAPDKQVGTLWSSGKLRGFIRNQSGITGDVTTTNTYNDDAWHMVVLRCDGGTIGIRLSIDNGAEIVSDDTYSEAWFDANSVSVGRHGDSTPLSYLADTEIDDVRFFDDDLSSSEEATLWNSGNGTSDAIGDEVLWWRFDDGSGSTAVDSSGNGYDGTLYNMEAGDWVSGKVPGPGGADTEVVVWSSQDGTLASEEGIQTYGDPDGRHVIEGKTIRFNIGGTEEGQIDANANWDFEDSNLVTTGTFGSGEITVADSHGINLQEDITFTGATTENLIKMPDNLTNALSINEGANSYLTFVTTNSGEKIEFGKKLDMGDNEIEDVKSLAFNDGGATITQIKDEDNMASNSATMGATQQSIKAYSDLMLATDGTKGRVLRRAIFSIYDGTDANTVSCNLASQWNGDAIAQTDNIAKGGVTGDFYLHADGSYMKVEASGLSGNVVGVWGHISYNASGSDLTVTIYQNVNDILVAFYVSGTGAGTDIAGLVDVGAPIQVEIAYITDA